MTVAAANGKILTLVIAVYNNVRYLEYILVALQRQTMREFEVIVADDGSGPEIAALVERMQPISFFPIRHLWQPDEGFRKNMMLNRAIKASETDYLVFIDGDCLPQRFFLEDHLNNRRQEGVLCGRRVNLSRQLTGRLTADLIRQGSYERLTPDVWFDGLLARSSNLEDGIRIPNQFLRRVLHRNKARILGCNFSVAKQMLERINGFNEDYRGPGIGEDTDIGFRLCLAGGFLVTLRYQAILYHLYHPITSATPENKEIFEKVEQAGNPLCANGLRKLSIGN
jgi:glycosyltransferase involved in cell wall biosynthesis